MRSTSLRVDLSGVIPFQLSPLPFITINWSKRKSSATNNDPCFILIRRYQESYKRTAPMGLIFEVPDPASCPSSSLRRIQLAHSRSLTKIPRHTDVAVRTSPY